MRAAIVALGVIVLAAGCAANRDASGDPATTVSPFDGGEPQRGGKLVYAVEFDANTWAPFVERWLESGQVVAQAFYEPLATFDERGAIKPYLAKSITSNPEFTEWTIALRPGVKFHSGEPLDATAVKLNLEKQGAGSGTNLSVLSPVTSVDIVDPMTVRLTMSEPWASFPVQLTGQLGNQVGYMASPKLIREDKPRSSPDGTGPFVVDAWEPGVRLTAKRNPDYWQKDLPYLDALEFKFIVDHDTRLRELAQGNVDAVIGSGSTDANLEQPNTHVITTPTDQLESFVVLNTSVAPLDDKRVREALVRATDLDALLKASGRDGATRASGPFSNGSKWFNQTEYPGYDPTKARALIDEVQRDKGPVKLELTGWSTPEFVRMQQQLADQWKAAGIEVTLRTAEQKSIPATIAVGTYQAALFQKYEGLDPDSYTMFLTSANINPPNTPSLNFSRVNDPQIDAAIELGRSTNDLATRKTAYGQLQKALTAYIPFVWLYHASPVILVSDRVHALGLDALPDGGMATKLISGRHTFTRIFLDQTQKKAGKK